MGSQNFELGIGNSDSMYVEAEIVLETAAENISS